MTTAAVVVYFGSDKRGNISHVNIRVLFNVETLTDDMCLAVATPAGEFRTVWLATVDPFLTAVAQRANKERKVLVPISWGDWHLMTALPEHLDRYKLPTPAVFATPALYKDMRAVWNDLHTDKRIRTLTDLAHTLPAGALDGCLRDNGPMSVLTSALRQLHAEGTLTTVLAPPLPAAGAGGCGGSGAGVDTEEGVDDWHTRSRKHRLQVMEETLAVLDTLPPSAQMYELCKLDIDAPLVPTADPRRWMRNHCGTDRQTGHYMSFAPLPGCGPCKKVVITNQDTLYAAADVVAAHGTAAVLNMSSARRLGGGYLSGAGAQEEELCRRTTLSCVFASAEKAGHVSPKPLTMLYVPHVTVLRAARDNDYAWLPKKEQFDVSMLCAAALRQPPRVDGGTGTYEDDDHREVMRAKIELLLAVAAANGHKYLVLGAWGTGAYGHPVEDIALLFRDVLLRVGGQFEEVVFAIIGDKTLRAFQAVFPATA